MPSQTRVKQPQWDTSETKFKPSSPRKSLGEVYHGECQECGKPMWTRDPRIRDMTICPECAGTGLTGEHPESVDKYFEQISKYKLFTAEEERACAIAMRKGDEEARHAFILANLRLVVKIAHEYRADFFPLEDRISEGNLGLLDAVARFDPYAGFRFSTYAVFGIRHYILKAMCSNARAYRIPPAVYGRLTRYRKALELFYAEHFREPTDQELAAALECPLAHVSRFRNLDEAHEVSINDGPSHGDPTNGHEADEFRRDSHDIPDPRAVDPARAAEVSNLRDELDSAMLVLDKRERAVLTARFPLDGTKPMKVGELAQEMGFSLESIRLVQNRAIAKVRDHLVSQRGITLVADLLPLE